MRLSFISLLLWSHAAAAVFDAATHPPDALLPARPALQGTLENGMRYVVDARTGEMLEDKAVVYVAPYSSTYICCQNKRVKNPPAKRVALVTPIRG